MGAVGRALNYLFGQESIVSFRGTTAAGKPFKGSVEVKTLGVSRDELECDLEHRLSIELGTRIESLLIEIT